MAKILARVYAKNNRKATHSYISEMVAMEYNELYFHSTTMDPASRPGAPTTGADIKKLTGKKSEYRYDVGALPAAIAATTATAIYQPALPTQPPQIHPPLHVPTTSASTNKEEMLKRRAKEVREESAKRARIQVRVDCRALTIDNYQTMTFDELREYAIAIRDDDNISTKVAIKSKKELILNNFRLFFEKEKITSYTFKQ